MHKSHNDEDEEEENHHRDGEAHTGTVSMKEFDDSFNVIIGSTDQTINLLDNPYINFRVYEINQEFLPKPSETVKLK